MHVVAVVGFNYFDRNLPYINPVIFVGVWLLLLKIENISFISCNTIYKNKYEYRKNIADMEH